MAGELRQLADAAWDHLADMAASEAGGRAMRWRARDGWSAVAHLDAARLLLRGASRSPTPTGGDQSAVAAPSDGEHPLTVLAGLYRAAMELAALLDHPLGLDGLTPEDAESATNRARRHVVAAGALVARNAGRRDSPP